MSTGYAHISLDAEPTPPGEALGPGSIGFLRVRRATALGEQPVATMSSHAEAEERYRLALTACGDGMFDLDLCSGKAFWGDRLLEMLGYGPDEVPSTTHAWFAMLVHPDDHGQFTDGGRASLQADGRFEIDARLRHADGAYVRYCVRGATQRDERGKRIRLIGAVHDLSAERRAELQRLELARELHDGVVQDLAAAAVSAASARAAIDGDPDGTRELLDVVAQQIKHSTDSLRLLLQSLRADTSLLEAQSSIDATIRMHVEEFSRVAPHVALDLSVDVLHEFCPTPVTVQTVSHVLREALRNVSRHAHASRLAILLHADDSGLRLEIQDNGIGFDDASTPSGHYGLVGMAERARGAGGALQVDSIPGVGTSLTLRVPRPFVAASDAVVPLRGRARHLEERLDDGVVTRAAAAGNRP